MKHIDNAPNVRHFVLEDAPVDWKDSMHDLQQFVLRVEPRQPNDDKCREHSDAKSSESHNSPLNAKPPVTVVIHEAIGQQIAEEWQRMVKLHLLIVQCEHKENRTENSLS